MVVYLCILSVMTCHLTQALMVAEVETRLGGYGILIYSLADDMYNESPFWHINSTC